jgi:hypothetical protein
LLTRAGRRRKPTAPRPRLVVLYRGESAAMPGFA